MATNGIISWLPIPLMNASRTSWQLQKQRSAPQPGATSIGDIWRSCKRPENTQIRVPLRNELLEQTCLALILFVSTHVHDVFALQYKIALSTDFH